MRRAQGLASPEPMKASQKIALEMSIKREKLNALLGEDELDDAQRGDMGALTVRRLGHDDYSRRASTAALLRR